MKNSITWKDKYLLSLRETLSLKEICLLCDVGLNQASIIRSKAIKHCLCFDIPLYTRQVPTEAVLYIIKHDIDYYYNKMLLENRAFCLGE